MEALNTHSILGIRRPANILGFDNTHFVVSNFCQKKDIDFFRKRAIKIKTLFVLLLKAFHGKEKLMDDPFYILITIVIVLGFYFLVVRLDL